MSMFASLQHEVAGLRAGLEARDKAFAKLEEAVTGRKRPRSPDTSLDTTADATADATDASLDATIDTTADATADTSPFDSINFDLIDQLFNTM
jgi:hypothetical protein